MTLIDIPTEQTTAVTDVMLALQSGAIRYYLGRAPAIRPFWTKLWSWIFTLMVIASLLGAVAHGFEMTKEVNATLWVPLYLALGLIVALFTVAAVSHTWDDALAQRCLPFGIGIGFLFFVTTQLWSNSFTIFVAYEAVTMLIVLALYTSCFWRTDTPRGSGFLALGVFVGILAAVVDAQHALEITFIWTFDNHGVFHLVQMLSFSLLAIGLYQSHLPAESGQAAFTAGSA